MIDVVDKTNIGYPAGFPQRLRNSVELEYLFFYDKYTWRTFQIITVIYTFIITNLVMDSMSIQLFLGIAIPVTISIPFLKSYAKNRARSKAYDKFNELKKRFYSEEV